MRMIADLKPGDQAAGMQESARRRLQKNMS
jgi:hypothetical protein